MFGCALPASLRIFLDKKGKAIDLKLSTKIQSCKKNLDEMGQVPFLLDEMGLDEMALNLCPEGGALLYQGFILLFALWWQSSVIHPGGEGVLVFFATNWYRSRNTDTNIPFYSNGTFCPLVLVCICAHILKLNCRPGFLTSCLETELDSATVPGSCFESIPLLASIPTTGFPELRTRIWSFIPLTQEAHAPVFCPLNGSTVRAVLNLLQQAIHHDSLQSRGGVAT